MTDSQNSPVYPMHSGEGHFAVINGNFVCIKYWPSVIPGEAGQYTAAVDAFLEDDDNQYQSFDRLADAVAWAVATAQTHQGQADPPSKIVHWEMRHGLAITVTETDDGGYESETFPMWHDIDPSPIRDVKRFPTRDEALQYARDSADAGWQGFVNYHRIISEIGEALASQIGNPADQE